MKHLQALLEQRVAGIELSAILLGLWILIAVATAGHALLTRRDARAAWGWIAVCWLFPFAGPGLYLLFGVNRLRTRARRFVVDRSGHEIGPAHASDVRNAVPSHPPVPGWLDEVARTADVMTRRPLLGGNRLQALHSGDQAYPRMLEAIAHASESVWLASYIFDRDEVGRQFADALAAAQERGVQVRVLIDGAGEWYSIPRIGSLLKKRGLRVARFNPLRLIPPSLHLNLRSHRKLLIVDGAIGFTGGINLSARHLVAQARRRKPAIDLHFELHGPVVAQMAEIFAEDWAFADGERLAVPAAVPAQGAATATSRVIIDGPNEDLDQLDFVLHAAISAAKRDIQIMTPYFLPSAELIAALQGAALRGVRTQVLLPLHNNLPYVDWAMRAQLHVLLERGVRVRFQPGHFNHAKLFVVDEAYLQIGSANWDPRSLLLNFELNVENYDPPFAREMSAHFAGLWDRAQELTLDDTRKRSLPVRLRDALCWLFSPYL